MYKESYINITHQVAEVHFERPMTQEVLNEKIKPFGLSHPALLLKCALFVAARDRVAGKRAGDTALAIFRR